MRLPQAIHPVALVVLLALPVIGCSSGGGGSGPKPYVAEGSISTVSATVEAIDHTTRQVTLKGEPGDSVTFTVDDRVRDLDVVRFTAPERGVAFVYDRSTQNKMYSGWLKGAETLEVDAPHDQVRIGERVVAERDLRDQSEYEV